MVETIQWSDSGVVMIDQTRLPRETAYITCTTYVEVADAIRTMVIRGAPAIGVAAAMGVALGVQHGHDIETVSAETGRYSPDCGEPLLGHRSNEAIVRFAERPSGGRGPRGARARSADDQDRRHRDQPGDGPPRCEPRS